MHEYFWGEKMIDAASLLEKIRVEKPLVHHITNWVTIYDCANITRQFGALPVMAHAVEEVDEMVNLAGALVLNIGTLTPPLIESMIVAGREANKKGIPVILDAVGAGATKLRTQSALHILNDVRVDILKGNYAEIGVLAGADAEVKGVESVGLTGDPLLIAKELAAELKLTVVATGAQDIVTDGATTLLVGNGHEMMGSIVGTGCMAASVIGSFAAVEKDYVTAAASALACYGIAGENAAKVSKGPGSFHVAFFDSVAGLCAKDVRAGIKVSKK